MNAEILVTGTELLTGPVVDNHSAYIARKLEAAGVEVIRHSCVGDDPEAIEIVLKEISQRSEMAVITGGLGPTDDDTTAVAAARAAGVEVIEDSKALNSIKNYLKNRQIPLTNSRRKQAFLPKGSKCLINPIGTAPGFWLKIDRCQFFFLPGVPSEMQQMLANDVIPAINASKGTDSRVRLVKTLTVFGLPESTAGEQLAGFEDLFPQIKLGFRVNFPEIQVKLYARGSDEQSLQEQLEMASRWACRKLDNRVFSEAGESMPKVVGDLLRENGATVATAESCTGGLIADLLTDVSGSSDYFLLSTVTYANQAKMKVLGVSGETLDKHGAVSEETAKEMAKGVQQISGSTYGLATSGIAGPGGGTEGKPVGTVCIGLATADLVSGHRFSYHFDNRRMNKHIFAVTALDLLRRDLLGIKPI
ncbi:MAG: competence/damage-inducible protein A [Desulfobacterales bacterium]|nr:competence/damage-inducible protein A [Desulfobacterales bacterium]